MRTAFHEVVICEPYVHKDTRGYFVETFRKDKLEHFIGYRLDFCQDNESKSSKGVLRGLHYQIEPYAQTKLVRVIKGKVQDVVVDIRQESPTFGKYISIELSDENKRQILVPKGFAHGFLVLTDEAIVAYKTDNYYSPKHQRCIAFNDPDINISWNIESDALSLSEKDMNSSTLKEITNLFE